MISGIVLAAGASSRMGSRKQLLPYRGQPLLQHVVDVLGETELDEVVVVLGHAASEISEALRLPPIARVALNPGFSTGQSSSLKAGLRAASDRTDAAMILLGDQPDVPSEAILAVRRAYLEIGGPVVRVKYRGQPGHPVLLDRSIWTEVMAPSGDRGAGPALERHPEWVTWVDVDLPPPLEVDTPHDYRVLLDRDRGSL